MSDRNVNVYLINTECTSPLDLTRIVLQIKVFKMASDFFVQA